MVYKGRHYDSVKEATRARDLDLLKQAGEVIAWFPHELFDLPGCQYEADFVVIDKKTQDEVKDLAHNTEGNFTQDDIKAICDNALWLLAEAQLSHTKQQIKEMMEEALVYEKEEAILKTLESPEKPEEMME